MEASTIFHIYLLQLFIEVILFYYGVTTEPARVRVYNLSGVCIQNLQGSVLVRFWCYYLHEPKLFAIFAPKISEISVIRSL